MANTKIITIEELGLDNINNNKLNELARRYLEYLWKSYSYGHIEEDLYNTEFRDNLSIKLLKDAKLINVPRNFQIELHTHMRNLGRMINIDIPFDITSIIDQVLDIECSVVECRRGWEVYFKFEGYIFTQIVYHRPKGLDNSTYKLLTPFEKFITVVYCGPSNYRHQRLNLTNNNGGEQMRKNKMVLQCHKLEQYLDRRTNGGMNRWYEKATYSNSASIEDYSEHINSDIMTIHNREDADMVIDYHNKNKKRKGCNLYRLTLNAYKIMRDDIMYDLSLLEGATFISMSTVLLMVKEIGFRTLLYISPSDEVVHTLGSNLKYMGFLKARDIYGKPMKGSDIDLYRRLKKLSVDIRTHDKEKDNRELLSHILISIRSFEKRYAYKGKSRPSEISDDTMNRDVVIMIMVAFFNRRVN